MATVCSLSLHHKLPFLFPLFPIPNRRKQREQRIEDERMQPQWPETAEPPALAADDVHVWSVRLDAPRDPWTSLMSILATDERERAARFRLDEPRRRFVVARATLRRLLGKYLQLTPDEVVFRYSANGKPHVQELSSSSDLQFNLAHSGELALVAVTRGCEVGVDVERLRDVHHWQEIAERFFHSRELNEITASPIADRLAAFIRCWAGKEAVLKSLGAGVTRPLDFFVGQSVPLDGEWIEVLIAGKPERYRLYPLAPAAGYIGAVACLNSDRHPRCFTVA